MVELREELRLPLESGEPLAILDERGGQHLDRHVPMELLVSGAIDLPHPPGAQGADDRIGPHPVPCFDWH